MDANMQDSCEVFVRGSRVRRIVYGLSREQLVNSPGAIRRVLGLVAWPSRFDWREEVVVTPTRTLSLGLPTSWRRTC